ncbi:hypothetical protein V12B01_12995 [Vibrio splendidus 12B01]|nr:hypothetical protein V12B01_12995 [Vibrio splendidus 12B01]
MWVCLVIIEAKSCRAVGSFNLTHLIV